MTMFGGSKTCPVCGANITDGCNCFPKDSFRHQSDFFKEKYKMTLDEGTPQAFKFSVEQYLNDNWVTIIELNANTEEDIDVLTRALKTQLVSSERMYLSQKGPEEGVSRFALISPAAGPIRIIFGPNDYFLKEQRKHRHPLTLG